jgi:hypothetical protein
MPMKINVRAATGREEVNILLALFLPESPPVVCCESGDDDDELEPPLYCARMILAACSASPYVGAIS